MALWAEAHVCDIEGLTQHFIFFLFILKIILIAISPQAERLREPVADDL